mgnify:CR=1 FL=1
MSSAFVRKSARFLSWNFLKWLFLLAAIGYLSYQLITFEHYSAMLAEFQHFSLYQFLCLVSVLFLLPSNWWLESVKWEMLVEKVQKIDIKIAFKSVLNGILTSFFTPNRVGDFVGRIVYLDKKNKKAGFTLSIINSFTQNFIMIICGMPAFLLFVFRSRNSHSAIFQGFSIKVYLIEFLLFLLIGIIFYIFLPFIVRILQKSKVANRFQSFFACLSVYNSWDLLKILMVSLLRYFVFSLQFFLMLRCFGVDLYVLNAMIAIPCTYLFVTFTPSLAFSEVPIRSSYAVIFIGAFSHQLVQIMLATACVWAVNYALPLLGGSFFTLKKEKY